MPARFFHSVPRRALFASIFVIVFVACGDRFFNSSRPIDFFQFWMVGQAARVLDARNVYAAAEGRRVLTAFQARAANDPYAPYRDAARFWSEPELRGTPSLYAVFSLFSTGSFETDYNRFRRLSLLLFMSALFLFARAFRFPAFVPYLLAFLLTVPFTPFGADVHFSNVGRFQVGALALFFVAARSPARVAQATAGFLIAALTLFKPNLWPVALLFAAIAVMRRRGELDIPFAAGAGLGALYSGLFLPAVELHGAAPWSGWIANFGSAEATWGATESFLWRVCHVQSDCAFVALTVALSGLPVVIIAARARRLATKSWAVAQDASAAALGIGLAILLLSWKLVHKHYFVLAVPVAMCALRRRPERERFRRTRLALAWAGAAAAGVGSFPFDQTPPVGYVGIAILYAVLTWDLIAALSRSDAETCPPTAAAQSALC